MQREVADGKNCGHVEAVVLVHHLRDVLTYRFDVADERGIVEFAQRHS